MNSYPTTVNAVCQLSKSKSYLARTSTISPYPQRNLPESDFAVEIHILKFSTKSVKENVLLKYHDSIGLGASICLLTEVLLASYLKKLVTSKLVKT